MGTPMNLSVSNVFKEPERVKATFDLSCRIEESNVDSHLDINRNFGSEATL